MPYATHDNLKIYYDRRGEGSPVVLLMGLGLPGDAWALQMQDFAKHHTVITIDNRDAGRSDLAAAAYSVAEMAADVDAVLTEAGIPQAHVVGVSMGGLIAQAFYHAFPQRVRSLVLVSTGVGANDPAFVAAAPRVLEVLRAPPDANDPLASMQAKIDITFHPDYIARTPGLVERLVAASKLRGQPRAAYERQLAACFLAPAHWNSPRLGMIRVPTLVVHGDEDQVWPLANAERLAAGIPGAKLATFARAGHQLFVEKPVEFNQLVLGFLAEVLQEAA